MGQPGSFFSVRVEAASGLLRDLAAEVGVQGPEIVTEALRTVGLDAAATGSVPAELEKLGHNQEQLDPQVHL